MLQSAADRVTRAHIEAAVETLMGTGWKVSKDHETGRLSADRDAPGWGLEQVGILLPYSYSPSRH